MNKTTTWNKGSTINSTGQFGIACDYYGDCDQPYYSSDYGRPSLSSSINWSSVSIFSTGQFGIAFTSVEKNYIF